MDDKPAKNTSDEKINKIDLSAFEAFEFGTQWSEASSGDREDRSSQQRTGRGRSSGAGGPPPRRDRRPPRREMQTTESRSRGPGAPGGSQSDTRGRPDRRPPPRHGPPGRDGGDRGPQGRRDERSDFRGRPPRGHSGPPRPYLSPVFEITFYPDDHGFNALVKAMRASCRTYELFEIARLILEKPERCVVVYRRRKSAPDAAVEPLFISVPDSMPFDTEEEAIRYTLDKHMDKFFTMETVEVEPPKGTFQFVNRCPVTKILLGPPNYHRYPHILQHHYETHAIRIPFEEYKLAIEVVKEPEAVEKWIESTKTATRYTFKGPEGSEPLVFDSPEDARTHLLAHCRDQVVRATDSARLPAKVVTEAGRCEAEHALQGAVEMQRRFPLDTANALRGRLRRENFHIFKRGSKGVTYVCSVRRKFRRPGEVFSDSITKVVEFLDKHPRISIADLPEKFLGFSLPHHPAGNAPIAAAPVPSETEPEPEGESGETPAATPAQPEQEAAGPTPEQKAALDRMIMDLRWLVGEGYVAEYSDGRLFVHPTMEPSEAKPSKDTDDHHEGDASSSGSAETSTPAEPVTSEPATPKPDKVPADSTVEAEPSPKVEASDPSDLVEPEGASESESSLAAEPDEPEAPPAVESAATAPADEVAEEEPSKPRE